MVKKERRKLTDCTPENVFAMFRRLGGFEIKIGTSKHTKIVHLETGRATTIPRNGTVNRHLLEKNVIGEYLIENLGFTLEEIYKKLKC